MLSRVGAPLLIHSKAWGGWLKYYNRPMTFDVADFVLQLAK